MEDSELNSLDNLFNSYPFVIQHPKIKITQELISLIYHKSKLFSLTIENYIISEEKYLIKFSNFEKTVQIKFYKENQLILSLDDILKNPYEVILYNIDNGKSKKYLFLKKMLILK